MRRVVITGMGMVSPIGNSVEDSWESAIQAKSGIDFIKGFEIENYPVNIAAQVKDFDVEKYFDVKEAKRTTRFCQFAVAAAKEAVEQSGLDTSIDDELRNRWGVSIGVGLGALQDIEDSTRLLYEQSFKRVSPFFIPYAIPNMAAGLVSKNFGFRGPNICPTTACSSGTHGVGEAFRYIQNDLADVMIGGGAEAAISPLGVVSFGNMKALSREDKNPQSASRPFDLNRSGFVMGEGCGVLILEELSHAQKRGAQIIAEVVGYGMSGDAYHITAPPPAGEGAVRCMKMAIKYAGINVDEVDYINAHGTSTKLNDAGESQAVETVFGDHAKKLAMSSTKSVTGHCLGAAGGIEAVFTAAAIQKGVIPPTAHYETPDPDCRLDYVPNQAREAKIRYALSNSFGFGGTNATLVFKQHNG